MRLLTILLILLLAVPCYAQLDIRTDQVGHSIQSGAKNATTTAVALSSSAATIVEITILADEHNSDVVYVGNDAVTENNGYKLITGATVTIRTDSLGDVYILKGSYGDGAQIMYLATNE